MTSRPRCDVCGDEGWSLRLPSGRTRWEHLDEAIHGAIYDHPFRFPAPSDAEEDRRDAERRAEYRDSGVHRLQHGPECDVCSELGFELEVM